MKKWKHINFEQRKTIASGISHKMKLKDIALKIGLFSHNYRALFRNLKGFVFD